MSGKLRIGDADSLFALLVTAQNKQKNYNPLSDANLPEVRGPRRRSNSTDSLLYTNNRTYEKLQCKIAKFATQNFSCSIAL